MKKTFFLLFFNIILSNLFAQQVEELPMKNGKVYFTFTNKLDNTKYCLSKYYNSDFSILFQKKLTNLAANLNSEKSTAEIEGFTITFSQGFKNNLNCKDTILSKYNTILFPINKKEKISERKLTFNVEVIFHDKNNYTLNFKGFILWESYLKGASLVTNEIKL